MQLVVWKAPTISQAMFRCAGAFRSCSQSKNVVAGLTDCWTGRSLVLRFTISSSAALYQRTRLTDSTDLRRPQYSNVLPYLPKENNKFTHKDQPSSLAITAGGGSRPRAPRVWKTKPRRGSIAKSLKFVEVVHRLSNVKEEIYNTLDAFIAWDLEFPLIAVKKALKVLADNQDWRRVIQVTKWMLDKGQGKTLATYAMLLEAFDHEGRVEEAEVLWIKLLQENGECLPRIMFARMISLYDRYEKPKELLKVFVEMEELRVKPDQPTLKRVSKAYAHFGHPEYAEALFKKYPDDPDERIYRGRRFNKGIPEYTKRDSV